MKFQLHENAVGLHFCKGYFSMVNSKKSQVVSAPADYRDRVATWNEEDAAREAEAEKAKKNRNFYMTFKDEGSPKIRKLIRLNGVAAELFLFIGENMDKSNALVASGKAFAAALETSEASISRALKVLDEQGYIARFKTGGSNVVVANPDIVWNSWATGKTVCLFNNAKVLLSKDEQDKTLVRKFSHVLAKKLPEDGPEDVQTELENKGQKRLID